MLKNYLKIAFRSLWRSKIHSAINVIGLTLGIACCVLITLFVRDELTFDRFHSKAERIYRVYARENWGENQQFFNTTTPFPMGPALKENFPEVELQVRFNKIRAGMLVKSGDRLFNETIAIGGQDFFSLFDFKPAAGNLKNVLLSQSNVVITRRISQKLFGDIDPINKVISVQLGEVFEEFSVKAVLEDLPVNSSIQFGILISELNYPKLYAPERMTAWFDINPETYVLLRDGTDPQTLEQKFPSVFKTLLGEENFGESKYAPGLQPLISIHLDTSYPVGIAPTSDPKYSYILSAIALLLLLVACINFVTLSIGRSMKRTKEVGIRKVVGAKRSQLIFQFIGEAVLITLTALVAGLLLAIVCLPLFNDLSGKSLSLQADWFMFFTTMSLVVIIGLIAGSYPAFVLSNFRPIAILKGGTQVTGNVGKHGLRKVLVGVQLVLSIFLISSTMVMRQQLDLLQNKNLGFNKEQLAIIPLNVPRGGRIPERIQKGLEKARQFKIELGKLSGVAGVCAASHDFGNGDWVNIGFTDSKGIYRTFAINTVDDKYITTLKMEMIAGRNFSSDNTSDVRRAIIVNEAFAKEYGWTDPIGKKIPGKEFVDHEVIGVVKDFNYASLYTKVQPLVLTMDPLIPFSGAENINVDNSPIPKLMIKLRAKNIKTSIAQIGEVWSQLTGGEEFSFSFADQTLNEQYRNDQNLGKIVGIATLLAMIIGSLGLYALASLAMQNRTKEISIRKVFGATEKSLLLLLSKDYVLLIIACMVLSVPITYYWMRQWLQSFEYRVTIGAGSFLTAGGISLMIAICTISYQAIKIARTQPADTLKCE